MATYKLTIDKVWVPAGGGQGLAEGTMEVRVRAKMNANGQELSKTVPDADEHFALKAGGAEKIIGSPIGEVANPPPGGQTVSIEVWELDGGLLGKDDYGSGQLVFKLAPGMSPTTQSVNLALFRPRMSKPRGSVSVQIRAEEI